MQAVGTQSDRLPIIIADQTTQNLKVFADTPEFEDAQNGAELVASSRQSAAIILSAGTQIRIEETRVPWWNIRSDQLEYATIPATQLKTEKNAESPVSAAPETQLTPTTQNQISSPSSNVTRTDGNKSSVSWLIIALVISNLFSWGLLVYLLIRKPATRGRNEANTTVRNSDAAASELFSRLDGAEADSNTMLCYQTILQISTQIFGCSALDELKTLSTHNGANELRLAIEDIETALFAANPSAPSTRTVKISSLFTTLLQTVTQKRQPLSDLESFYPLESRLGGS
jgi:hypothetical protein